MKKLFSIFALVILGLSPLSAFAAVSYSRDPAGSSVSQPIIIDVGFDSLDDWANVPSGGDYWSPFFAISQPQWGATPTTCLPIETQSGSFAFSNPSYVGYSVTDVLLVAYDTEAHCLSSIADEGANETGNTGNIADDTPFDIATASLSIGDNPIYLSLAPASQGLLSCANLGDASFAIYAWDGAGTFQGYSTCEEINTTNVPEYFVTDVGNYFFNYGDLTVGTYKLIEANLVDACETGTSADCEAVGSYVGTLNVSVQNAPSGLSGAILSPVMATLADSVGINVTALVKLFIKIGIPFLIIIAIWFFGRRLARGKS